MTPQQLHIVAVQLWKEQALRGMLDLHPRQQTGMKTAEKAPLATHLTMMIVAPARGSACRFDLTSKMWQRKSAETRHGVAFLRAAGRRHLRETDAFD